MGQRSSAKHSRMAEFDRVCRERGLPLTMQRRAVFGAILSREDHPTADQIFDSIKSKLPSLSRTSVYRILDTLVETGMVTRICHPGSGARFDPHIGQHHHLVCMKCQRIFDLEAPQLDSIRFPDVRKHGFEINEYHIHFRGTCAQCRREMSSNLPSRRTVGAKKPIGRNRRRK